MSFQNLSVYVSQKGGCHPSIQTKGIESIAIVEAPSDCVGAGVLHRRNHGYPLVGIAPERIGGQRCAGRNSGGRPVACGTGRPVQQAASWQPSPPSQFVASPLLSRLLVLYTMVAVCRSAVLHQQPLRSLAPRVPSPLGMGRELSWLHAPLWMSPLTAEGFTA
jgi:hypothetical protein